MVSAKNAWIISFDNLSYLPPWLSDAICRLATGGGLGTRELYTDDEEIIFEARRPVIFNGIEELATQADLLDRSAILCLAEIPDEERRDEEEFWKAFEQIRARVLGALLDVLSAALSNLPMTKLTDAPRMADATKFVTAAEPCIGWEEGGFLAAYRRNREAANDLALEASPVAKAIQKLVDSVDWMGTAEDLLERLRDVASEDVKKQRSWPANALSLSNKLRRLAPSLRRAGISVEFYRENGGNRERTISIKKTSRPADDGSFSDDSWEPPRDGGDDRDAGKQESSGPAAGDLFEKLDNLLREESDPPRRGRTYDSRRTPEASRRAR
jgi:hypothetical protein